MDSLFTEWDFPPGIFQVQTEVRGEADGRFGICGTKKPVKVFKQVVICVVIWPVFQKSSC